MGGSGSGTMPEEGLIRLDGTFERPDGTISRTKMFEFLEIDLDDYGDIEMTPREAQKFTNHVKRMKTGLSAFVPKLCPGPTHCPLADRCPFENRWPVGRACPLEVGLVKFRTRDYIESLSIDVGSPYQMSLVDRLVELDVFEYRSNLGLSATQEGASLLKTTFQETKTGDLLESVEVHPYLQAKDTLYRKRINILEALVATPREEYKRAAAIKKKDDTGLSSQLAAARSMIDKIKANPGMVDIDQIIEEAGKLNEPEMVEADWEEVTVPIEDDSEPIR